MQRPAVGATAPIPRPADLSRLVKRVSAHFSLTCRVTYIRVGRSRAWVRSRRLALNPYSPLGRAVALHEFAHLLAERRVPGQGHWHKTAFREALLDTLAAAGVHPTDYPWHREYRSVAAWARRRGFFRASSLTS